MSIIQYLMFRLKMKVYFMNNISMAHMTNKLTLKQLAAISKSIKHSYFSYNLTHILTWKQTRIFFTSTVNLYNISVINILLFCPPAFYL